MLMAPRRFRSPTPHMWWGVAQVLEYPQSVEDLLVLMASSRFQSPSPHMWWGVTQVLEYPQVLVHTHWQQAEAGGGAQGSMMKVKGRVNKTKVKGRG